MILEIDYLLWKYTLSNRDDFLYFFGQSVIPKTNLCAWHHPTEPGHMAESEKSGAFENQLRNQHQL